MLCAEPRFEPKWLRKDLYIAVLYKAVLFMLMLFMLILMLMLFMLILMLMLLMLLVMLLMLMPFFADDHYVCSSVVGSLCSRRCAPEPLWDYVNVRLLLEQDFEPVSSRIGLFIICTRISICIDVGPFQLATPLQTALSAIKEIPQL